MKDMEYISMELPKATIWRREWEGDVSDENHWLYADEFDQPDKNPNWQSLYTEAQVREAIAAALVKLTQGQEPVAWERRLKFPQAPGAVGEWEKCGKTEATSMFDSSPLHEYRCLYTHPIPSQQEERVRENAVRWRFALIESPEWTYAVCKWNGQENEWLPIRTDKDIAVFDAARNKEQGK